MGKCILKRFGILTVNKVVSYTSNPNPKFIDVCYGALSGETPQWHTVSIEDVELI